MRVVAMMLVSLLFGAMSAAPQSDVVFTTLGIDLWPDYDRPGVLVIYRANLAPGVALPTPVTFRIPAAAGAPTAVAERQTDGQLITLPFERRVEGDTAFIEMMVTRPVVQMEYYDPALERDGAVRRFTFTWPGDYEVGALSVSAQQPDLAQNLTTIPAATIRDPGADGLMYHTVSLPAAGVGDAVDVHLSYEKVSDQLSTETMVPADPIPTTPVAGASTGGSDTVTVVIVMGAFLVIGLVVAGAVALRSRQRSGGGAPVQSAAGGSRFCTQCGAGGSGGDRFCHQCGAPLR